MTSATQSVNEQVVVSNNFSLLNSMSAFKQGNSQATSQRQTVEQLDVYQQVTTNSEKKDALEFFIANSLERQETAKEEKEKGINRGVKPITELGPEIPLFSVYAQVMLQDSAFYLPKEIYKKQRVVDNQRLLRSLNNDKKYTEMIDGQYR